MATASDDPTIRCGVFSTVRQAVQAVEGLLAAGFGKDQVSVLCSDEAKERHFREYERERPAGSDTPEAAATGGVIGALLGGLVSAGVTTASGLALLLAGPSFLIGGVWYSPLLFANAWMREAKITEEELRAKVAPVFAGAFVLSFVIALNLAMLLGKSASLGWGAGAGALAGVGFAAMSLAIVFLFERRSTMLIVIDGGYLAVSYTVMGVVIAAIQ